MYYLFVFWLCCVFIAVPGLLVWVASLAVEQGSVAAVLGSVAGSVVVA